MATRHTLLGACLALLVLASVPAPTQAQNLDPAILNFALNLEYLEANFYSCAAYGKPLPRNLTGGGPTPVGCKKATLSAAGQKYAEAIAKDEIAHVVLLRSALGKAAVPQPALDIGAAFSAAANAAIGAELQPPFDAYGSDTLFYHAAFALEDVGVTAYKGAARLITNKDYLEVAAGILAVEAYHGGAVRSLLLEQADQYVFPYGAQVKDIVAAISKLRAGASGASDDAGLLAGDAYVLAPADSNSVAYSRSTKQVISIVTLGSKSNKGGFFPKGLNGQIK